MLELFECNVLDFKESSFADSTALFFLLLLVLDERTCSDIALLAAILWVKVQSTKYNN